MAKVKKSSKAKKVTRRRKLKEKPKGSEGSSAPRLSPLIAVKINGFKRFSKLDGLDIKPLTVVTGANSSGKSSLLHALIFLKQSLEEGAATSQFIFDGLVKLGSFERVLNDSVQGKRRSFRFDLDLDVSPVSKFIQEDLGVDSDLARYSITVGSRSRSREAVIDKAVVSLRVNGSIENILSLERINVGKNKGQYAINSRHDGFSLKLSKSLEALPLGSAMPNVAMDSFVPSFAVVHANIDKDAGGDRQVILPIAAVSPLLGYLSDKLDQIFNGMRYVGPLRSEPSDLYTESSKEITPNGDNAMAFLKVNADSEVEGGMPDGSNGGLLNCVNAWSRQLDLSGGLEFKEKGNRYFEAQADGHYLNELGCGIGQALPVLIQCLAAKPKSVVVLEQPEIHLHQSLQANLCDFFLHQIRRRVKLIVETHSEILILRLRRRIAESGKESQLCNDVALYWVSEVNGSILNIKVDDRGGVSEWPALFFDQALIETKAIAMASI